MIMSWVIAIPKEDSTEPALYYNDVRGTWVQDCQGGCVFFDEKSANNTLSKLNVMGATVVKGAIK